VGSWWLLHPSTDVARRRGDVVGPDAVGDWNPPGEGLNSASPFQSHVNGKEAVRTPAIMDGESLEVAIFSPANPPRGPLL
jgi:hypothetical protein